MIVVHHFLAGGWAMWFILFWLLAVIFVAVERAVYFFGSHQETSVFTAAILKQIEVGDWDRAFMLSGAAKTPLGRVAQRGISRASEGVRALQEGFDEAALHELPAIHRNVGYLALFANLAMLCGLFGTIVGLIKSFGSVGSESIDLTQKSRILADGIAEAMNCTAFGLLTAIIALVAYAALSTWAAALEDGIQEVTVKIYNAALQHWSRV